MQPQSPTLPIDFEALLPRGLDAIVDAEGLGALLSLVRFAWTQDPPCTLPCDERVLQAASRLSPEGWSRCRDLILGGSFARELQGPSGPRLLLLAARGAYDSLLAKAEALAAANRQRTARATAVRLGREVDPLRAASRGEVRAVGPPLPLQEGTSRARDVLVTSTSRQRDVASVLLPPHTPPSSSLSPIAPIPAAESTSPIAPEARALDRGEGARARGDVIALVGEAARARASDQLADWRVAQSRELLFQAHARWRANGRTKAPISKALEIARDPRATPARVETAIDEAESKANPIGYVLTVLMQSSTPGARLIEPALPVAQRWAEREERRLKELQAVSALQERLNQARHRAGAAERPLAAGV